MGTFGLVLVLTWAVVLTTSFLPTARAQGDNELRANEVYFIPMPEIEGIGETTLRIENSDRWRDGLDDYFYHHNEFTLRVPIPAIDGLNWEAGYRRRDGDVGGQNAYLFNLTWNKEQFRGSEWEARVRNQWELTDPDGSSDQSYKGKFRILLLRKIPWVETKGIPWKIGFGDEITWEPESERITENQLGAGIQIPLSRHALIQVSSLWQRLYPVDGGEDDDNLLLTVSFQYSIPRRTEKDVMQPFFNRNLEKEF